MKIIETIVQSGTPLHSDLLWSMFTDKLHNNSCFTILDSGCVVHKCIKCNEIYINYSSSSDSSSVSSSESSSVSYSDSKSDSSSSKGVSSGSS